MLLLSLVLAGCAAAPANHGDLANATFTIENRQVSLQHGQAAWPAAPGSAAVVKTRLVGEPGTGDIDGDGEPDAVVWLRQTPGGSGTFYYLAPAIRKRGGYAGGTAVFVGDRIAPNDLTIRNGVIVANYADRASGEPMALPPHLSRTRYLTWEEDALRNVEEPAPAESLLQGWLVMGHEVREFSPCSGGTAGGALWVLGASPALQTLRGAYHTAMRDGAPYTPIFVSLIGRMTPAPDTGFGERYPGGLNARMLVNVWPAGTCRNTVPGRPLDQTP